MKEAHGRNDYSFSKIVIFFFFFAQLSWCINLVFWQHKDSTSIPLHDRANKFTNV